MTTSATLFRVDEAVVFEDLDAVPRRIGRSSLLWVDSGRDDQCPGLEDRGAYTRVTTTTARTEHRRTNEILTLASVLFLPGSLPRRSWG